MQIVELRQPSQFSSRLRSVRMVTAWDSQLFYFFMTCFLLIIAERTSWDMFTFNYGLKDMFSFTFIDSNHLNSVFQIDSDHTLMLRLSNHCWDPIFQVDPDSDLPLKTGQENNWHILCVHNGIPARLLQNQKIFCNERRSETFLRKICKHYKDFLVKKVRSGSSTIRPEPTWSECPRSDRIRIYNTGSNFCTRKKNRHQAIWH